MNFLRQNIQARLIRNKNIIQSKAQVCIWRSTILKLAQFNQTVSIFIKFDGAGSEGRFMRKTKFTLPLEKHNIFELFRLRLSPSVTK